MKQRKYSGKWSIIALIELFFLCNIRAQQEPGFDTPAYTPDVSHRTNFCSRLEAVQRGEIQRRSALQDLEISIAVFDYQLNSENTAIDREKRVIAFDILDAISYRAGFTWRDSYGVVPSPLGNETWDGVLDWSIEVYDLLGDWMIRSVDRIERGVQFPEPWYDASLIMVRKQDSGTVGFNAQAMITFLAPFSPGVWIMIVINFIISGIVYHVVDYLDSRVKKKRMEAGLSESIFSAAYALTGHSLYVPKTTATRIVAFSIAFVFLFVESLYTANMANFLIGTTSSLPEINEVYDAIKEDQVFCLMDSSAADTYFQQHYPNARLNRVDSSAECYAKASNYECDICISTVSTWNQYKRNMLHNPGCKLEWVGRPLDRYAGAFSLKNSVEMCSSLFDDVVTVHMLDMKMDGTFDDIWNGYMEVQSNQNCDEVKNEDEIDQVNLNQMAGIFMLHGFLLLVAVCTSLYRCARDSDVSRRHLQSEIIDSVKAKKSLKKSASVAFRKFDQVKQSRSSVASRFSSSIVQGSTTIASRLSNATSSVTGTMTKGGGFFNRSSKSDDKFEDYKMAVDVNEIGIHDEASEENILSARTQERNSKVVRFQLGDELQQIVEESDEESIYSEADVFVDNSKGAPQSNSRDVSDKESDCSDGDESVENLYEIANESDDTPPSSPQRSNNETSDRYKKEPALESCDEQENAVFDIIKGYVAETVSKSLEETTEDMNDLKDKVDNNSNMIEEIVISLDKSTKKFESDGQELAKNIEGITNMLIRSTEAVNALKREVIRSKEKVQAD